VSWDIFLTDTFLVTLAASGIRLAVPVLLAVLGEIFAERSGVLNLGLEGILSLGAFVGFLVGYSAGSAWLGLLGGLAAGAAMGLIMAFFSVTLKTNQVVAGISLVILGTGLSSFLFRQTFGGLTAPARVVGFSEVAIPGLSQLPLVGPILFNHSLVVYLTVVIVVLSWLVLFRTTWGLNVRAAGEAPSAADTSGLNVNRIRYTCVILGAALAGFGGSVLSVAQMGLFLENMVAGRGWIAIALVIFSRWRPSLALLGAVLFGMADALQFRLQALGFSLVPYEFLLMLPYVITIVVLVSQSGKGSGPAALGVPYTKETH
jgi:general nucleoside transport system permease protein